MEISKEVRENRDKLFKNTSYDIRAYVGEPGDFFGPGAVMTPEAMRAAGALMGGLDFKTEKGELIRLNPGETVVVGYDNGPTSKILAEAFSEGLNSQGVNVYDIGVASSGQVYQNQEQLGAAGHCQITRSHVEVTTNGAKFAIGSQGIHTYLLGQMNEAAAKGFKGRDAAKGSVTDKKAEAREIYFSKIKKIYGNYFGKRNNSKVAINVFGGAGVQYIGLFKDIFGPGLTLLGKDVNVNSGALLADPTRKEMLERVPHFQEALNKGLRIHSFDLDADRGSLTEGPGALNLTGEGHYLGDSVAFILADHKLKIAAPALENKLKSFGVKEENIRHILSIAKTVYVDPRYTSSVKTYVEKSGGRTEFHRKGHSLWKETITANMTQMAKLAGFSSIGEFAAATGYRDLQIEASLHLFSTDTEDGLPRDDAVENIFILEKVMDEMGITSLKSYFARHPRRFITKEVRTPSLSNETKEAVTAIVIKKIKEIFGGLGLPMVEFDGQIRVDWPTGFIMYGMSNTSPKLTFMAEGSDAEERNDALAFVTALHNEAKKTVGDDVPMDTAENPFYIKDKSYAMDNPDGIDLSDPRAKRFMEKFSRLS